MIDQSFQYDATPGAVYDLGGMDTQAIAIHSLKISAYYEYEIIRDGVSVYHGRFNGLTNVGLNNMLGVTFHGDTQQTAWYLFLISSTSYSALSASDTMASHAGWLEAVAYTESTRVAWGPNSPSGNSIANTTACTFTINADGTALHGAGVCSVSTKSGTTGILWSTGLFGAPQTLNNTDQVKITYAVNLSA